MRQYTSKGDWSKTRNWLSKVTKSKTSILKKYGERGVIALKNNTPVLTGTTAESWYYEVVEVKRGVYKIYWCNSNLEDDWFNVALYLQLGHATQSGAWVEGVDYINPALASIFTKMADELWDEYSSN